MGLVNLLHLEEASSQFIYPDKPSGDAPSGASRKRTEVFSEDPTPDLQLFSPPCLPQGQTLRKKADFDLKEKKPQAGGAQTRLWNQIGISEATFSWGREEGGGAFQANELRLEPMGREGEEAFDPRGAVWRASTGSVTGRLGTPRLKSYPMLTSSAPLSSTTAPSVTFPYWCPKT